MTLKIITMLKKPNQAQRQSACVITLILLCSLSLFINQAQAVEPPEHIVWQKTPIAITLPVGKERWVSFPEAVNIINQNNQLTFDKLHITNNAGTIYFKALKAFAPSRLLIHLLQSNTIVLLDVSAVDSDKADSTPLAILLPAATSSPNGVNESPVQHSSPIDLIRFAIGHVYPNFQQDKHLSDVHRVPLRSARHVVLFYGANTMATPLASWRSGAWYVSAILVQNSLKQPLTLDPRNTHGNWVAMSLFPRNRLAPIGDVKAVTTAMVLSHQPFDVALNAVPLFVHPPMGKSTKEIK